MAKLTTSERNSLPNSAFAIPEKREYPIEDKSHAVAAMRLKSYASSSEQKEIASKVKRRFPDVGKSGTNPVYE